MSSPAPELLIQENLCTDLFKTISESVEASSHSESEVTACATYSDEVIEQLLDRMVQILPPEERNIFGSTDEKNIEEIIEEANELIRTTTPLFSYSDSGDKSLNTTSKALDKSSESSNKHNPEEVLSPKKDKSECDSICSSLESIIVKDTIVTFTSKDEAESTFVKSPVAVSEFKMGKDNDKGQIRENELYEEISQKLPLEINELKSPPQRNPEVDLNKTPEYSNTADGSVKSRKERFKSGSEPWNSVSISTENKLSTENKVEKSNKTSQAISSQQKEPGNKLDSVEQKYVTDVQELKLSHNKEIYGLKEQINRLNDQIYNLQKQCQLERSPDLKQQQLEHLENELKSQEQLISGYERENKKLCKEISTLKEVWKQRQNQLVEEKQRLQNELQGMVSKSTTEALEEQLKDARETIVKLQIELTTYKTKNKELEAVCDRLRRETQHLQIELSNCRCERAVGRRDKYSFLASSNVGQQIQDLKNVIGRKDSEIEQLNTKLGVLRGELGLASPLYTQSTQPIESHSLTVSQLQTALAAERQTAKELTKEKEFLLKENLDLKRQVRELESIVKRRQRSDSCFAVSTSDVQSSSRLIELEKELTTRQESLSELHAQFLNMQKKYEEHTKELEGKLKESREEIQNLKVIQKKDEASHLKSNMKKFKQGAPVVKEETHLLATIRGLRQEAANREKEMNKLNKEIEEVRQTNRKLQKEREKHLNSIPNKMTSIREKANLRKMDKMNNVTESRANLPSPNNNNVNPILYAEVQESNLILTSKTKSLQDEVKRLEKDLITMHNKRVHDLKVLQSEHDMEVGRLMEERATFLSQSSATELQGQVYTQQMVINHLKNRLKQMEELKNEITLLRAERDHLEENLGAVNKKMCHLQNAQSPESIQYKTLLAKLEMLEKNQEIREQKLNAVRELLCRSTQGQGQCSGSCRDKLLDKNRQICYYRAQMDRILESLLEVRRTK